MLKILQKMTKLIIFDLDGTLIDTMEDIANACNYALRQCGCPERRLDDTSWLPELCNCIGYASGNGMHAA